VPGYFKEISLTNLRKSTYFTVFPYGGLGEYSNIRGKRRQGREGKGEKGERDRTGGER